MALDSKPDWSRQRQSDPPHFGDATLVDQQTLEHEIARRKARCDSIIQRSADFGVERNGRISIVILSCKRLVALQRLIPTLKHFLHEVEDFNNFDVTLADNGSGEDLLSYVNSTNLFDQVIHFEENLGMVGALRNVYPKVSGEYILFLEDDFVVEAQAPCLSRLVRLFNEFPEIGIIRLKNQNNWWKPFRRISPLRSTSDGTEFWTWLPEKRWIPFQTGRYNVWAAGSVMFRRVSYFSTGELPDGPNLPRSKRRHQGYLYEYEYAKKYNRDWLAAKVKDCYPFFQPNDEPECPGWQDA